MTTSRKPDFVTHDGKEVMFNFNNITLDEWRSLFRQDTTSQAEDEIIAKVCNMDTEEIRGVGFLDWRLLLKAIMTKAASPLDDDPN